MSTEHCGIAALIPPHGVLSDTLRDRLAESMAADGWVGRPLLGIGGQPVHLLTGSHRYAAADVVGLDAVPVWIVPPDDIAGATVLLNGQPWDALDAVRSVVGDTELLMILQAALRFRPELDSLQGAVSLVQYELSG